MESNANQVNLSIDDDVEMETDEGADSSDEEIACAAALLFGGYYLLSRNDSACRRKLRSVWTRNWLLKRESHGAYSNLIQELRAGDAVEQSLFCKILRMTPNDFDYLLNLVTPLISKMDTRMRKAISPGERLAITLYYLATGQSYSTLQFMFRVSQSTITLIVPEVLDAIWTVLKGEYMKVRFIFLMQNSYVYCYLNSRLFVIFPIHRHQTQNKNGWKLVKHFTSGIFRTCLKTNVKNE